MYLILLFALPFICSNKPVQTILGYLCRIRIKCFSHFCPLRHNITKAISLSSYLHLASRCELQKLAMSCSQVQTSRPSRGCAVWCAYYNVWPCPPIWKARLLHAAPVTPGWPLVPRFVCPKFTLCEWGQIPNCMKLYCFRCGVSAFCYPFIKLNWSELLLVNGKLRISAAGNYRFLSA